jgi:hypothetical protein
MIGRLDKGELPNTEIVPPPGLKTLPFKATTFTEATKLKLRDGTRNEFQALLPTDWLTTNSMFVFPCFHWWLQLKLIAMLTVVLPHHTFR